LQDSDFNSAALFSIYFVKQAVLQ